MSNKSLIINFIDPPARDAPDKDGVVADPVSFELDAERHLEIYGEERSSFDITETAYIRFLFQGASSYSIFKPDGDIVTCVKESTRIFFKIEDLVQFLNSDSGSITYTPAKLINYNPNISGDLCGDNEMAWMAPTVPPIYLSPPVNKIISTFKRMTGTLRVKYSTRGDRLAVTSNEAGTFTVGALLNGTNYSLSITFTAEEEPEDELETYIINVTSLCAEGVISGVEVKQNGLSLGESDGCGQITFESYPGTYSFCATKEGYEDIVESVTLSCQSQ